MTNSPKIDCPCGRTFTRTGYHRHVCDQKIPTFTCEFCKKDFTTERRLIDHLCEPKRRHMQKDDKPVRLAFTAYERFCKLAMNNTTTYEKFAKSTLYTAFVKFGRHLVDLNPINPLGFIDFLIRGEIKIDKWTSFNLYSTYVRELNKNEPPLDAIERNFMLMEEWSISSDEPWNDFFRKVAPSQAALWIVNGRISPWLLFTASSAFELLQRFTPEQNEMMEKSIDTAFWKLKIERHKDEVNTLRAMLAQNGI